MVVGKNAGSHLADFFKSQGLFRHERAASALKWRGACLITSLCSGNLELKEAFVKKFWEFGGVKAMLDHLKVKEIDQSK